MTKFENSRYNFEHRPERHVQGQRRHRAQCAAPGGRPDRRLDRARRRAAGLGSEDLRDARCQPHRGARSHPHADWQGVGAGKSRAKSGRARAPARGMEPARCRCAALATRAHRCRQLPSKIFALRNAMEPTAAALAATAARRIARSCAAPGRRWCRLATTRPSSMPTSPFTSGSTSRAAMSSSGRSLRCSR